MIGVLFSAGVANAIPADLGNWQVLADHETWMGCDLDTPTPGAAQRP